MNWTVQCVEYYLYRGVSRTNAYEFMQQSGFPSSRMGCLDADGNGGASANRGNRFSPAWLTG